MYQYHNLLSCKLYRWHSLCYQRDHKGNGMLSSSSPKNVHDQTLSARLPLHALTCPCLSTNAASKCHAGSWYALTLRSVFTPPDDSTILDLSSATWYLTKYIFSPYPVELVDDGPIHLEHLKYHLEFHFLLVHQVHLVHHDHLIL